jgi:microcompartment protein CcmK/EutM
MILAKVVGTVVSSHKVPKIEGISFLLLEKIDPVSMKGKNDFVVAMDSVGAGIGEVVFYVSGSSARFTPVTEGKPTDCAITAIVDFIENDGKYTYRKDNGEL